MRKKRTRNLKLSDRGVLRYRSNTLTGGTPSIRVYLQDASEPDRPHLLAMDIDAASELARLLSKALAGNDKLEIEAVR